MREADKGFIQSLAETLGQNAALNSNTFMNLKVLGPYIICDVLPSVKFL